MLWNTVTPLVSPRAKSRRFPDGRWSHPGQWMFVPTLARLLWTRICALIAEEIGAPAFFSLRAMLNHDSVVVPALISDDVSSEQQLEAISRTFELVVH